MLFSATTSNGLRPSVFSPAGRSLERFLSETQLAGRRPACSVDQDEKFYTLNFDLPGLTKDQVEIDIEGSLVRIKSKEAAPRQYQSAYELPQEIDVVRSEARLENGVLILKLGKQLPAVRSTRLTVS